MSGLLVSGFKLLKGQRAALLDELMAAVLPNLATAKRTTRSFVIGDGSTSNIQMISALLLQFIQVRTVMLTCMLLHLLIDTALQSIIALPHAWTCVMSSK